jgi:hypothetical protein
MPEKNATLISKQITKKHDNWYDCGMITPVVNLGNHKPVLWHEQQCSGCCFYGLPNATCSIVEAWVCTLQDASLYVFLAAQSFWLNRSQASSLREPHPAKRTYPKLTKGSHHCHVTITSSRVMQDSAPSPLNHELGVVLSLSHRHWFNIAQRT